MYFSPEKQIISEHPTETFNSKNLKVLNNHQIILATFYALVVHKIFNWLLNFTLLLSMIGLGSGRT